MTKSERLTGEIDKPLLKRPSQEVLAECLYKSSPVWVTHEFEWLRYERDIARQELADTIADRNNLIEQRDSVMAENERLKRDREVIRQNELMFGLGPKKSPRPSQWYGDPELDAGETQRKQLAKLTRTMELLITQMGSTSG